MKMNEKEEIMKWMMSKKQSIKNLKKCSKDKPVKNYQFDIKYLEIGNF